MKLGLQAHCRYFQLYVKNDSCGSKFRAVFAPNRDKIAQYRFSSVFLKSFHWKWSYFCRCVKDKFQRPIFYRLVLQIGLLDSHQSCFICSLELLSEMCTIWAPHVQVMGHLGPKISQNWGLWSFSHKLFTGFTWVLLHMLIASTFRCVENMGRRGPILGPLWTPK